MQKIKMQTTDGVKEYSVIQVLNHLNYTENLSVLQAMDWQNDGKKKFLTGEITALSATIAEPLTEEEADKGIKEYLNSLQ